MTLFQYEFFYHIHMINFTHSLSMVRVRKVLDFDLTMDKLSPDVHKPVTIAPYN